jgi:carbon monoxide dehydrogenase subunit G
MELSGKHNFDAPQAVMWRVLTDPDTLRRCLPGCQKFDPLPDGSYAITLTIGIAAIKGTYTGTVHLLNEQPPDSYTLKMSAKGGVGFVDGRGDFKLAPDSSDKTLLTYTGEAHVGGKVAGLGQRVVHAGANLVIGQFFRAIQREVNDQVMGNGC